MKYTHYILVLVTMLSVGKTCVGNTDNTVDPGGKGRGSGNQDSPDDPGGKGRGSGNLGSPGNPGISVNPGGTGNPGSSGGSDSSGNQVGSGGKGISGNPGDPDGTDDPNGLHNQDGNANSEEEKILGQYFTNSNDLASIIKWRDGLVKNVCKLFQDELLQPYEEGDLFQKARYDTNLSGQGRATLVRKLNEKKSNPDLESIEQACQWSDVDMLKALIKSLKDKKTVLNQYIKNPFNDAMETILYIAVRKGKGAIVQVLLDEGADPNKGRIIERTTTTPLYGAVRKGYVEIVNALLSAKNIDPNQGETVEGEDKTTTPLALAEEKGNQEIIKLLKEKGAQ